MANTIFSSEGALLFIMVATVALGFWLQRFKVFKTLGPALTVIVMGIVMSNLRIVPTSSPTYDAISSYCVPLSVSICLLSLDLKQMRKLSKEPIIALASAIFSVCVAALVFGILFANKIDEGWKVAGMFVGTYTGGSSNLTAIAVGLDASKNTIASANAADYVVGIPTLILMFATPALYKSSKWLKKLWPYDMSESELLGDGNHEELMASKEWSIQESPGCWPSALAPCGLPPASPRWYSEKGSAVQAASCSSPPSPSSWHRCRPSASCAAILTWAFS